MLSLLVAVVVWAILKSVSYEPPVDSDVTVMRREIRKAMSRPDYRPCGFQR